MMTDACCQDDWVSNVIMGQEIGDDYIVSGTQKQKTVIYLAVRPT